METVRIDTPQNVAIEYNVATIVSRGFAAVLDWMIVGGYVVLLWKVLDLMDVSLWDFPEWVLILLLGVPALFYNLLFEILMDGRSIGKRVLNLRVARLDGGQPSLGDYLMRWVLRPFDSSPPIFLGAMVILFNGKGQRLGDIAAGTCVISLKRRVALDDTLLVDVPDGHVPVYAEVVRMTDDHARLLKRVLRNTSTRRRRLVEEMAERVKRELQLTTEQPAEDLLKTVLIDYVHFTGK
jgi:uncharacterized RDD family membrane protein YckC